MTKRIIASALLLGLMAPAVRAADDEATTSTTVRVTSILPVATAKRPVILPVLYVGLAGLQAYDVYSTRTGLSRGAAELNPIVAPVAGDTSRLIVLKAASTATTIYLAERLWHNNKTAAILTMIAANGVMAAVAAHNAVALRELR
jgi:hypothetical protein